MVCLSMEDLKFASELADLIGSGREFHKRMVLGKKEWRCVSILERGTKSPWAQILGNLVTRLQ